MLDIRIDGHSVDLQPGTQIALERYNPMLDFTTVQGSRVNSFTLPDSPKNRRILGYLNDPQAGASVRRFYCEKYVNSQVIEEGFVKVQEATSLGTLLYFTKDLANIFGDSQVIPLSEIPFAPMAAPPSPLSTADQLVDPFCFPSIENPAFYGNQGYSGIMNQFDRNNRTYADQARVPHFFLKWVLSEFGRLTKWTFQGDFLNDPDFARLILTNLYSLDGSATIYPANHLPDMTAGGLLIELRKLFNLFLDFDVRRGVCDLSFVDDVLKKPCLIDWTDKANPVHTKLPETVNRLDLGYELDGNDALTKPIPAEMDRYLTAETAANEGGSVLSVRSKLSTYLTAQSGLAKVSQAGISVNNKDNQNKGTPKVLFWNGLVNGFPTATNQSGNKRLVWHGENNLVDNGYRRFERFKGDTFLLKKLVMLTPADLAQFSFKNKVHIKGVNYIVGAMKLIFTKDQKVIPADCELWRV